MADALKDSYQLRPIADHEVDELLTEIDNCIQHVEQLISPISLELDKFPAVDVVLKLLCISFHCVGLAQANIIVPFCPH